MYDNLKSLTCYAADAGKVLNGHSKPFVSSVLPARWRVSPSDLGFEDDG